MTLESTLTMVSYVGNGQNAIFDIPFKIMDREHLSVSVHANDGESRVFREDVDYEIVRVRRDPREQKTKIVGVKLKRPLSNDWVLTLRREVPITQEIVFHNQGPNSPSVTEESLDKLTMICQQLSFGDAAMDASLRARMAEVAEAKADALHAARHRADGADPVTPSAIGAMPAAPAQPGAYYMAKGDQWVETGSGSLPVGGEPDDMLVNTAPGVGVWLSPAVVATMLPAATSSQNGTMTAADKRKLDSGGMSYGTVTLCIGVGGNDATGTGTPANPFATFAGMWNHVAANYNGSITRLIVSYLDGVHNHNIRLPNSGGLPSIRYLIIQGAGLAANEPRATINMTEGMYLTGVATYIAVNHLKLVLSDSSSDTIVTAAEAVIEHLNFTGTWFRRGATAGRGIRALHVDYMTINGHVEFEGVFTSIIEGGNRCSAVLEFSSVTLRNGSTSSYFLYFPTFGSAYVTGAAGIAPTYDNFTLTRFAAATVGTRIYFRSGVNLAAWSQGKTSVVDSGSVMAVIS